MCCMHDSILVVKRQLNLSKINNNVDVFSPDLSVRPTNRSPIINSPTVNMLTMQTIFFQKKTCSDLRRDLMYRARFLFFKEADSVFISMLKTRPTCTLRLS